MKLKLALFQLDLFFGNPEKNRNHIAKMMENLETDTDIVVLPELWNTAYQLEKLPELADVRGEKSQLFLQQLAQKYQITLVGGSVATQLDDNFYNQSYTFTKEGKKVGDYQKKHLFKPMREPDYFQAGKSPQLSVHTTSLKTATIICYDLRFPETIIPLVQQGISILFVVAQWPVERIYQWKQLLIARGIENQLFVVGVNRIGRDPSSKFGGHSLVVNPFGYILAEASDSQEEILYCEIDTLEIEACRKPFSSVIDRENSLE